MCATSGIEQNVNINTRTMTDNEAPQTEQSVPEQVEGPSAEGRVETQESKPSSLREALERDYDRLAEKAERLESSESEDEPADGEESPEQAESKNAEAEKPEKAEKTAEPTVEPPVSWSKKDKAVWSEIPEAAQKTIARREAERDRAIQDKARDVKNLEGVAKEYGKLQEKIEPYARSMKMKGKDYIQNLIQADELAIRNPLLYLEKFVKNNGIDLTALVRGDREMAHDSELHQYRSELQAIRGEVEALRDERENYRQYAQQQNEAARLAPMEQVITGFMADKPAEEVQAVSHTLPTFIQLVKAEMPNEAPQVVLQEAYDRAVWSNPQLRQASLDRDAHAKRKREQKAAQEAKRTRGLRSRAPGSSGVRPKFNNDREMLEAAWNGEI